MYEDDEFVDDEFKPEGDLFGKIVDFSGVAARVVHDDGEVWATVVMIGDDRKHQVDRDSIKEIPREDYCMECGQVGCAHDGYDRGEA
jgi:hypothetical protein